MMLISYLHCVVWLFGFRGSATLRLRRRHDHSGHLRLRFSREQRLQNESSSQGRQAVDAPKSRPQLRLTFQTGIVSDDGLQFVKADSKRLAMFVRDHGSQEGVTFDFMRQQKVHHQLFFDELVCYRMDLGPTDVQSSSEQVAATVDDARVQFHGIVGQVFGVPLELYERSTRIGIGTVVDTNCELWQSNTSWSVDVSHDGIEVSRTEIDDSFVPPHWLFDSLFRQFNVSTIVEMNGGLATLSLSLIATFCITASGDLLSTLVRRQLTHSFAGAFDTDRNESWTVLEKTEQINVTAWPNTSTKSSILFEPGSWRSIDECVDLRSGTRGSQELRTLVNNHGRLQSINSESGALWTAVPYNMWEGMRIEDFVDGLGTDIQPLKLSNPNRFGHGRPLMLRAMRRLPKSFDARLRWHSCLSIGIVRNQAACGSCWAMSATSVLADRFCIAARRRKLSSAYADGYSLLQLDAADGALMFSPGHLLDCDNKSQGCEGGRLDNAWEYLRDFGVPREICSPYLQCSLEEGTCSYGSSVRGWRRRDEVRTCSATCVNGGSMGLYRAASAYVVAAPADTAQMRRELLTRGPIQSAFFVFSDFHSYRRGVYFRTPGAYGPLGGHAVKLIGWGVAAHSGADVDYWLAVNSWSPSWGMGGLFKIRRGTNECGVETTTAAGVPAMD